MPRRHLTFVVVAIASLVVSACSASPTGPRSTDPTLVPSDSSAKIGTMGSNG